MNWRMELLGACICLTAADRAITVAFFEHEGNPLVKTLGPSAWVLATVSLLALYAFFYLASRDPENSRERFAQYGMDGVLGLLTAVTGLAVLSNVAVVALA